jgi:ankyrin repeat protein
VKTLFQILLLLLATAVILFVVVHKDRRPRAYFAAEEGDTNAIAQYLASGNNVNDPVVCYIYGHRRAPLLNIAAGNGQLDIVSFLLKKGANPNQQGWRGDTPLICVIGGSETGRVQIVEVLLKAGANPDLRSADGWTPLIYAATLREPEIVSVLLAAGAHVDATDNDGSTALHYAGNAEVARLLIAAGADRNARLTYVDRGITNVVTPADSARKAGKFDVLAVITNSPIPNP